MSDKNKPQQPTRPPQPKPTRTPTPGPDTKRDRPLIPNHVDPDKPWPRG